jgi:microcystin degradation protein MlrC
MAFVAIADGDAGLARAGARRLARLAWEMREQCDAVAQTPDEAIRQALATADPRPVVLLDVGDNVGAGTAGDSAILLEALMRLRVPSFLMSIWDVAAVEATSTVGGRVEIEVGGKTDPLYGPPVRIRGVTRAVGVDAWEDRKSSGGWISFDAGPATIVDLDGGGTILLTTRAVPAAGAGQFAALGVDAANHRIIVSKAVYSTRDGYPMASGFIPVDTPGLAASNLRRFLYHHRRRPMLPFEPDATYD